MYREKKVLRVCVYHMKIQQVFENVNEKNKHQRTRTIPMYREKRVLRVCVFLIKLKRILKRK